MSGRRTAADPAQRTGSAAHRLRRVWRGLPHERRLAAGAAVGLFVTLFLPWYQETVIPTGVPGAKNVLPSASLTGWAAFSFVEAAVLLVAVGVLVLLFVRAEGKAFHVPGGDGGAITAAGFWTGALIVWRMFDKEGTSGHGQFVTTSGIEWGIFIALGVAALLAYTGSRIKQAHEPEPPLPGERPAAHLSEPAGVPADPGSRRPSRRRPPPRPGAARAQRAARPGVPTPQRAPRPEVPTPQRAPGPETPAVGRAPAKDEPARPRHSHQEAERITRRGLNFSELDEIQFDEPPEAPTIRRQSGPEDQLTIRLDQPD